jgi:hypothetical protein
MHNSTKKNLGQKKKSVRKEFSSKTNKIIYKLFQNFQI